jgi:hypothetical protein
MYATGIGVVELLVYICRSLKKWLMFCSLPGEPSKKTAESTWRSSTWKPSFSMLCLLMAWVFWRTGLMEET